MKAGRKALASSWVAIPARRNSLISRSCKVPQRRSMRPLACGVDSVFILTHFSALILTQPHRRVRPVWSGLRRRSLLRQLVSQPITGTVDGKDVAVVKQAIKDRSRDHLVTAEDFPPLVEAQVRRHGERAVAVLLADKLEE